MTLVALYRVECDALTTRGRPCHDATDDHSTAEDARAQAQADGWSRELAGEVWLDICPYHTDHPERRGAR